MLDDVAAYLVISPLAAVTALVLMLIGWVAGRAAAPVLARRPQRSVTKTISD